MKEEEEQDSEEEDEYEINESEMKTLAEYNRDIGITKSVNLKIADRTLATMISLEGKYIQGFLNLLIRIQKPSEKTVFIVAPYSFAFSTHKLPYFTYSG
jgi:hypothetical protein